MDFNERERQEAIERAAREGVEQVSRLRSIAERLDTQPALLAAARRLRQRLPGDEKFGDPLSTGGDAPLYVVARGVSALRPDDRDSVLHEISLAGLQLWQSLSEAAGRGRGDMEMALLFTDLVGFSSWALKSGDTAALELLREVGAAVESVIVAHDGRVVKRLGDGVMATFLSTQAAVDAALEAQEAVRRVDVNGYRPQMRAGIHWGRPRRLGDDYLGVDVNIAARVGEAASPDTVLLSDTAFERIESEELAVGRRKRLKADGAPHDLRVVQVGRS
jgi:adenylate cyclase